MLKRVLCLTALTVALLAGCIGYNQEWDPSWTDDFGHEKKHFRAFWQDLASIHRFVDRHLFNFDETDPGRY
ncbi:MAG: hypothetical protein KAS70_01340 [Planctomycetes bacterium]|nr:hypothetical protein [Planctomycetota bacterium]MCK5579195.1 hypothetical protein [Planctomycetota bacterium]